MKTDTLEMTAEIALCMCLPSYVEVKPGRLQTLYGRLEKRCNAVLESMPAVTPADAGRLYSLIDDFEKSAGWYGKGRHVCTVISFLLSILDGKAQYSRIIESLNEIYHHFDSAGKVPAPCCWAGSVAEGKWRELVRQWKGENT